MEPSLLSQRGGQPLAAPVDLSPWAGDSLWGLWVAEIADANGNIATEIADLESGPAEHYSCRTPKELQLREKGLSP